MPNVTVCLEDTELGKLVDFDQNTHYTFNAYKGETEDRFVLHIKNATDPTNALEEVKLSIFLLTIKLFI